MKKRKIFPGIILPILNQRLLGTTLIWGELRRSRRSVLAGDIIKLHILIHTSKLLVSSFSLHVPSHHQLVHKHANDGSKERGKDWHQKPTIPGTITKQKKDLKLLHQNLSKMVHDEANSSLTYVKTSPPHPAMAVKRRGPKSLAGFTA